MSIINKQKCYNCAEVTDNMRPLKERISITLDNDLLEKIRQKAELDDRSLSQYINIVLKKHLEALESQK